jgi:hypothetical protein
MANDGPLSHVTHVPLPHNRGAQSWRFAVDSTPDSKVDSESQFSEVLKTTENRFSRHTWHLDRV